MHHFPAVLPNTPSSTRCWSWRGLPAFGLALALAACGTLPPPDLPRLAPAAWRQPVGKGPAGSPALATWWTAFGDPLLDRLVSQALAENLTLAQARSRVRQARLLAGRDNAQYRPSAGFSARPAQAVSATDAYYQASIDANWELGLFGAHEAVDRTTTARVEYAEAAAHAAAVTLVGEVVRSYVDLRAAQQQAAALERVAELDARAVALADVRVRTRIGAPSERDQARARLAQSRAALGQPRLAAVQAAQGLATLLGRTTPDPAWLQPGPQPRVGDFALTQVPADLLRHRPEIRMAEAEVFRASGELGSAEAELYPRVVLGASLLYSYNVTQNRPLTVDSTPVGGPTIDIPIFDWGRRKALAGARREALDAALLAYRQAVLDGVAETELALATLERQREREQELQTGTDSLHQRAQAQATLNRLGLASELDRVTDARAALQADAELAGARAARALAVVGLYKALGGAPASATRTAAADRQP